MFCMESVCIDLGVCVCVSATNPDMKKRAKVQHNFKVTSDGRLIIKEDNDEGDKTKGSRTHTHTQTPKLTLCYGSRERSDLNFSSTTFSSN